MKIDVGAELQQQISKNEAKGSPSLSKPNYPTVSIYLPSRRCGRLLYSLMGENFIWEVTSGSLPIDAYLPKSLPIVSPTTLHDYLKHHTRCGRCFTRLMRRIQVRDEQELFTDDEQGEFLLEDVLTEGVFNFVLLGDGRLIFTRIPETRRKYNYRMLSKHASLSRYSPDVRFAGEMRMIEDQRTLVINNNSGTYQPTVEMIEGAALYLHDLFPNLNVIGRDRFFSHLPDGAFDSHC